MFVKSIPNAVKSDGTLVPNEIGKGYSLGIGTYYIDVGIPDADHVSVHCTWDANIVFTSLAYQSSNLPAYASESAPYTDSSGAVDVSIYEADTGGVWLTENPSTAYVPIVGTGVTVTDMTVAATGGAGGAMFEFAAATSRRARMKIVTTTGGYFRCHAHGKQA